jgi:hypothetical protein
MQIGVVTDIREMRLQRLLTEAIVALELAEAELAAAEHRLSLRRDDVTSAGVDFAKSPSIEPIRIWRDVCVNRLAQAEAAIETARFDREEAEAYLAKARVDILKIKERGTKIAELGTALRRAELRTSEARLEDDVPAVRGNALVLEGED